ERLGHAVAGDGIHARRRRRGHRIVTLIAELRHELRSDEAGSTDHEGLPREPPALSSRATSPYTCLGEELPEVHPTFTPSGRGTTRRSRSDRDHGREGA